MTANPPAIRTDLPSSRTKSTARAPGPACSFPFEAFPLAHCAQLTAQDAFRLAKPLMRRYSLPSNTPFTDHG